MKKRIIPVVIVLAIAGIAGYWWWQSRGAEAANAELGGSGTIEAQQIAITPQTSGRIIWAPSEEGKAVNAGDVLYMLDSTPVSYTHLTLPTN
jgi:multidrug resistance efflux pump